MAKYYSQFWIQYCNGAVELNPLFAQRDHDYYEESVISDSIPTGRVRMTQDQRQYREYADTAACDIEGNVI